MAEPPARVSLQAIAQKAGVSAMTVSRVLGNSPRVASATRRRVLAAARALQYQPEPHLTRMMNLVHSRKAPRLRAVLAVIREDLPQNELLDQAYHYVPLDDIRRRAEPHGYHVEEFWLGRDGLTPERLGKILNARGIARTRLPAHSAWLLPSGSMTARKMATAAAGSICNKACRGPSASRCSSCRTTISAAASASSPNG